MKEDKHQFSTHVIKNSDIPLATNQEEATLPGHGEYNYTGNFGSLGASNGYNSNEQTTNSAFFN